MFLRNVLIVFLLILYSINYVKFLKFKLQELSDTTLKALITEC